MSTIGLFIAAYHPSKSIQYFGSSYLHFTGSLTFIVSPKACSWSPLALPLAFLEF
jgi:hypothetical protein